MLRSQRGENEVGGGCGGEWVDAGRVAGGWWGESEGGVDGRSGCYGDIRVLQGIEGGISGRAVRSPREGFLVGVEDVFQGEGAGCEEGEEDEKKALQDIRPDFWKVSADLRCSKVM